MTLRELHTEDPRLSHLYAAIGRRRFASIGAPDQQALGRSIANYAAILYGQAGLAAEPEPRSLLDKAAELPTGRLRNTHILLAVASFLQKQEAVHAGKALTLIQPRQHGNASQRDLCILRTLILSNRVYEQAQWQRDRSSTGSTTQGLQILATGQVLPGTELVALASSLVPHLCGLELVEAWRLLESRLAIEFPLSLACFLGETTGLHGVMQAVANAACEMGDMDLATGVLLSLHAFRSIVGKSVWEGLLTLPRYAKLRASLPIEALEPAEMLRLHDYALIPGSLELAADTTCSKLRKEELGTLKELLAELEASLRSAFSFAGPRLLSDLLPGPLWPAKSELWLWEWLPAAGEKRLARIRVSLEQPSERHLSFVESWDDTWLAHSPTATGPNVALACRAFQELFGGETTRWSQLGGGCVLLSLCPELRRLPFGLVEECCGLDKASKVLIAVHQPWLGPSRSGAGPSAVPHGSITLRLVLSDANPPHLGANEIQDIVKRVTACGWHAEHTVDSTLESAIGQADHACLHIVAHGHATADSVSFHMDIRGWNGQSNTPTSNMEFEGLLRGVGRSSPLSQLLLAYLSCCELGQVTYRENQMAGWPVSFLTAGCQSVAAMAWQPSETGAWYLARQFWEDMTSVLACAEISHPVAAVGAALGSAKRKVREQGLPPRDWAAVLLYV